MMFTIGKLAHRFNLSRSTLLYYDSIGLLSPAERGNSNYRLYSETDCQRLEQIAIYRQAGLSLQQIKEILDNTKCNIAASLETKIEEINDEINMLRQQQHFIIQFLQNNQLLERVGIIPKDALVELLQSAGVDERTQWKFHNQFEKKFPEKHESFLQLLGLN
ncbi:MAG: transcriptional regulator, MerR family, partial [Sporomusa sp.]|nr:transcriptional regulator, MerR family [Sporomusa sp.]